MRPTDGIAPGSEEKPTYRLKLYIADHEPNSRLAQDNLKAICEEYLKDCSHIEYVDILTDFATALRDRIFVTPTLVLTAPGPRATIVGNLGDKERVLSALRLRTEHGR